MTEHELAKTLALLEGKKSQARISDIRELIKLIQERIRDEVILFGGTKEAPILNCLFKKAQKEIDRMKKKK